MFRLKDDTPRDVVAGFASYQQLRIGGDGNVRAHPLRTFNLTKDNTHPRWHGAGFREKSGDRRNVLKNRSLGSSNDRG